MKLLAMSTPIHPRLADNLAAVDAQIAAAAMQSGRTRADVRLIAVTKYADPAWIPQLEVAGVRAFGESRPQQLMARARDLAGVIDTACEWHLIGHLQRNKARAVLPVTAMIHSVDSLELLDRIEQVATELGLSPRVLLEVNVSGETVKDGFDPAALMAAVDRLCGYRQLQIAGLMTMAPQTTNEGVLRRTFAGLRELKDELQQVVGSKLTLRELSMGMSDDFPLAIAEGATIIRVGSRLFEGLPDSP